VSLVVAGSFRLPPDQVEALRPHMLAVIAASRAEAGCLAYAYSEDLAEPGLYRVFERWTDQAALDVHFGQPHMAAWKAAREAHGFHDRQITIYDVAAEKAV
jgi:quinol monooxygenase YgiN